MDKYRVLLVDDEEEVRQAIARKLDWEAMGFEVVGEAGNGEEALELCEQLLPDVIMTDIKMPFMDGLTLCRKAKEILPGVKVAIFSGFDEFEYAKEAIRLEVEEYILKPIDADELAGIFARIKAALDAEISRSRDAERLQRHYEESLPMMQQQLLGDLLEGRIDADKIQSRFAEYELDLSAAQYCAAVVRYEDDIALGARSEGKRLLNYSLQDIVTEYLRGRIPFRLVRMYDSIVLLFLLPDKGLERRVIGVLNGLFPITRKLLGIQLSIGVGTPRTKPLDIATTYAEARSALEYQPLVDAGQCIYIGDIEYDSDADLLDSALIDDIVRQIKIGTREDLERAIGRLMAHFKAGHASLQQYQAFLLSMSGELLRLLKAYRLDGSDSPLTSELLGKIASHFGNIEEMGAWLLQYCDNLRQTVRRERKDSTRTMVETAKGFLEEHYGDSELSVDTLCSVLNLSPAYFSTIFKKETGLNFVGYLTQIRMEKALEYLHTTDDKTYMIAEKVGYTDPNYFSYVFKKHYSMSPSKYRTDRIGVSEKKGTNS